MPRAFEAGRLVAIVLGALALSLGLLLGVGALWVQLARALPLAELVVHPAAVRAMMLAGAGLGLLLLGRRGPGSRRGAGRPARPGTVSVAVAAALVAAGAGPALAVDATGMWSGRWSCRQKAGATITRTAGRHSTMLVTQRDEALFIEIDGTAYRGWIHASDRYPRRATGGAVRSTNDRDPFTRTSEMLDLDIRINHARRRTKISADSTVRNARGEGHCSYRFSRTSREDPGVAPATCEPLDLSGHWEGAWVSAVTGENGEVVADFGHEGEFVFGSISFPPFGDEGLSPPFLQVGRCAPAEFSTGTMLPSGVTGSLVGVAANTSLAGGWKISDGSDYGTWQLSRCAAAECP